MHDMLLSIQALLVRNEGAGKVPLRVKTQPLALVGEPQRVRVPDMYILRYCVCFSGPFAGVPLCALMLGQCWGPSLDCGNDSVTAGQLRPSQLNAKLQACPTRIQLCA
jgi:hypothetical protein